MPYKYPYTNLHEINLDRFMKCIKALTGGAGNQFLKKKSNIDFDFEWVDNDGGVRSVNGKTGDVTLTASDVGAIPDTVKPVETINNTAPDSNGNINITASDVGAIPDTVKPVETINNTAPDNSGNINITADGLNAITKPLNPVSGDFLVYNGSAWVAMALSVWQGGSY